MRILRSFRLRIALLGTSLSGLVLAAFAFYALMAIAEVNRERVDTQLRAIADKHVNRPGPPDWERAEAAAANAFVGAEAAKPVLLAKGRDGGIVWRSAGWPAGFVPRLFPDPAQRFPHLPPPPHERRPPKPGRPARRGPPPLVNSDEMFFETAELAPHDWRFGVLCTPHATVAIGVDLEATAAENRQIARSLLLGLLVGLVLIGLGGFLIAQRALRPVRVLGDKAEGITARGLHERIALEDADAEFQRLVNVFNAMLDRLDKGFQQATRFSADAAHELRTPLTVLQGMVEEGIQGSAPGSPEQARYSRLLEEVQRLKAIMDKLLVLSRADAGRLRINSRPVNLSALADEVCEDLEILAPHLRLQRRIEEDVWVRGDPDMLRQVVQNLANNAVKHNTPSGEVGIALKKDADTVSLTVANTGPAIPAAERARIFERFYRVDKARSRESGGVGLGLSLAQELTCAHGGELTLDQSRPGYTAFTLTLPGANPG